MSDLRRAAEMALKALEDYRFASGFERPLAQDAIDELRQALAQPEQEPAAWYDKHGSITHDPFEGITPLYTAPLKREWVGLTDGEREEATGWSVDHIEAFLKEKNGG